MKAEACGILGQVIISMGIFYITNICEKVFLGLATCKHFTRIVLNYDPKVLIKLSIPHVLQSTTNS